MTLLIAALSLCFNENEKVTTISLREIMPKDFSGKNLRGRNFQGQDLTGANFSYADIRGANFTNALLIGANFRKAKAGLPSQWKFSLLAIALSIAFLSGFAAATGGAFVGSFLATKYENFFYLPRHIFFNSLYSLCELSCL